MVRIKPPFASDAPLGYIWLALAKISTQSGPRQKNPFSVITPKADQPSTEKKEWGFISERSIDIIVNIVVK